MAEAIMWLKRNTGGILFTGILGTMKIEDRIRVYIGRIGMKEGMIQVPSHVREEERRDTTRTVIDDRPDRVVVSAAGPGGVPEAPICVEESVIGQEIDLIGSPVHLSGDTVPKSQYGRVN